MYDSDNTGGSLDILGNGEPNSGRIGNLKNNLYDDGIEIHGGKILGAIINSSGDHRIAMSFAIAGLVAKNPITILNTENVSTSFPEFFDLIKSMGLNIERETV